MAAPPDPAQHAPGAPGLAPTWTPSDKDLVGTAIGPSRLWFTLGHGIVNEIYHPRVDTPQIRDLGFIIADDAGFWVEIKDLEYTLTTLAPGVPLPTVVHRHPRFTLTTRFSPDTERDVLLIDVDLEGDAALRPYVLLAPHLGGTGHDNRAMRGEHRGQRVAWAEQGGFGLALVARTPDGHDAVDAISAGYVGTSDGWQDFATHGRMAWQYTEAGPGNVALLGAIAARATLALGFANSKEAAATLARAALAQPFDTAYRQQAEAWAGWRSVCDTQAPRVELPPELEAQFAGSAQVLKAHGDKIFPGAMAASLSIPWGDHGEERGGYYLVWPRDAVECAQAFLALGALGEARAILAYLLATQNADGHWHQNQWLDGCAYWHGVQLDETAFPVLLAARLAERDALGGMSVEDGVRRALAFLILNGPASPQDRWEEAAGVNPFTLALCIAALIDGAELLPHAERGLAHAVADFWNARLEDWCVARGTALGARYGVSAYYVRATPIDILTDDRAMQRVSPIKNHRGALHLAASEQIATDFLQLVRLGLRRADDTLVRDTLVLVDALLKTETPAGPVWHRYNGDGYGEDDEGAAFDGAGRGRGWPLLTGERGHYELAAGRDPLPYLRAMCAMANHGMIPEQVWDAAPLRDLQPGRATGAAMPLAWAHAEFIKLALSREVGSPVDRPPAVWARYEGRRPPAGCTIWTPRAHVHVASAHSGLWIVLPGPAVVHLGYDGWRDAADITADACGPGLYGVRLDPAQLDGRARVEFTWRDVREDRWQDKTFSVTLV